MNRTRGFVNLNRFKSGRAIKRLGKSTYPEVDKKKGKGVIKNGYGTSGFICCASD